MKIAVLQMTSGITPKTNAETIVAAAGEAARGGAVMMFTPEMSGLIDRDRTRGRASVRGEDDDVVLKAARASAAENNIWISVGSLAIAGTRDDGRLVNRSFLIDAAGDIVARYDKIHLFDVDLPTGESWRESAAYAPGEQAVLAETPIGKAGLSICYDLRFPALYSALTGGGATILTVPAAFTVPTGQAHWDLLLRARAVEGGAFVIAAAQTGLHEDRLETFGHSLVIDPWGNVLLDMGTEPGLGFCDLDLADVERVRSRIPVLAHRRPITLADTIVAS
jgi:predicted amidohydrolase